jgi:hypothetical protein
MSKSVKVYRLYPVPGGFSNRSRDYTGTTFAVAATSSRQAHALAHKKTWATDPSAPMGVLWVYRRGESPDCRLFTGDRVFGTQLGRGGKRAIGDWMRQVLEERV